MKGLIWILCFSTWAWLSQTQAQTVANGWIIEDIHGPSQVGIVDTIPVDINQDGLMDVVSASIDDGHLRAYINQGNYQFEQQYISKEVPGIYRVSAVDLNQDGQTDFLLPSIATHEIIGLIAETDRYRKQIIADDVVLPTDAQAADLNNDGLVDVASISFENNELHIHQQQANGSFQSQIVSFSANKPRKLQISDFNNDGMADILLASSGDDSVRILVNQGSFSFSELLISDEMTSARYVAECNLNNDNLIDFVVSATGDDTVYIFANIGDFQFEPKPVDKNLIGVNALHCADTDNDQQTELITVASGIGNIYTHELNANFDKQLVANTRDGYVSVNTATFMPNDPPKILTQAYFENRNLLYSTNINNQETVVWEDFPDGAIAVVEGDINGDGKDDIVVASFRDDKIQWYDGETYQHHIVAENIDGASEVFVTDLDKDGNMDILSAASFANSFYWHRNMGNKIFETIPIYQSALFANGIAAGDVDGDGKFEVIGTSGSDDSVWLFERQIDFFDVQLIDSSSDAPNELLVLDFNQDKIDDFVVPYYFSNEVVLYQSLNKGIFEKIVLFNGIQRAYDIVAGNFSIDTNPEFLISSVTTGDIYHFIKTPLDLELRIFITNIPQLNWFQILQSHNKLLVKSLTGFREVIHLINYPMSLMQTEFSQKDRKVFGLINDQSLVFKLILVDLIFANGFEQIAN